MDKPYNYELYLTGILVGIIAGMMMMSASRINTWPPDIFYSVSFIISFLLFFYLTERGDIEGLSILVKSRKLLICGILLYCVLIILHNLKKI
jgi:hypothetical protein